MISVLTPTGDRPECLSLLTQYIARQTFTGPIQWIVIDDGKVPFRPPVDNLPSNVELVYVRRDEPGVVGGSLNRNVIWALRAVTFDNVVVMEDDDWYAPTYLAFMLERLSSHDLVGEGRAHYYNVQTRQYRRMDNTKHASLAQTGWRSDLNELIDQCCRIGNVFIDKKIWSQRVGHSGARLRRLIFLDRGICVSIKGMPGRTGLTLAQTEKQGLGRCDRDLTTLATLLGGDVGIYAPYYKPGVIQLQTSDQIE